MHTYHITLLPGDGIGQEVIPASVKVLDRAMKFAFELAQSRRKNLVSATKSNGIIHTMPFWDERFKEMAGNYPAVTTSQYHINCPFCAAS